MYEGVRRAVKLPCAATPLCRGDASHPASRPAAPGHLQPCLGRRSRPRPLRDLRHRSRHRDERGQRAGGLPRQSRHLRRPAGLPHGGRRQHHRQRGQRLAGERALRGRRRRPGPVQQQRPARRRPAPVAHRLRARRSGDANPRAEPGAAARSGSAQPVAGDHRPDERDGPALPRREHGRAVRWPRDRVRRAAPGLLHVANGWDAGPVPHGPLALRRSGAALRHREPAARRLQARQRRGADAPRAAGQRLVRPDHAGRSAGARPRHVPGGVLRDGHDVFTDRLASSLSASAGTSANAFATAAAPRAIAGLP